MSRAPMIPVRSRAVLARVAVAGVLATLAVAGHAQTRAGTQFGTGSQLGNGTPVAAPSATPSWSAPPAWSMPAASAAPRGANALAPKPAGPTPSSLGTTAVVNAPATAGRKGDLFSLDDKTVLKADGKETSAAAIKQQLLAQIAAKAGPMKTVKASMRSLDTSVAGGGAGVRQSPVRDQHPGTAPGGLGKIDQTTATAKANVLVPGGLPHGALVTATATGRNSAVADMYCTDKGPPTVTEVDGTLRAGGKVKLWGKCFGDRTGRVEVIGQFPGGKLAVAFTSWSQTLIEIDVPATVRGAPDGTVAVTVVTAEGKATPAAQGRYVAARERVEVPDRMWSPGSAFETAATSNNQPNPSESGQLARNVRINPQCGLESMVADVIAGDVTSIDGFDRGPPNEAAVTIAWRGTCVTTKSWTTYNFAFVYSQGDVTVTEACRIALRPRAWAQCPVGIAP